MSHYSRRITGSAELKAFSGFVGNRAISPQIVGMWGVSVKENDAISLNLFRQGLFLGGSPSLSVLRNFVFSDRKYGV